MLSFLRTAALIIPLLALTACKEEGAAEKAGKAMDNAGQSVKDAISPPGPAEKAGRALDKAVN